jgi:hypothetical protein
MRSLSARMSGFAILVSAFIVAQLTFGCATSFTGSAFFPGGPRGCKARCERAGMAFGGFVYAGEYSTSCFCEPRGSGGSGGSSQSRASTVAPAAGVMLQQQRAAQQRTMRAN